MEESNRPAHNEPGLIEGLLHEIGLQRDHCRACAARRAELPVARPGVIDDLSIASAYWASFWAPSTTAAKGTITGGLEVSPRQALVIRHISGRLDNDGGVQLWVFDGSRAIVNHASAETAELSFAGRGLVIPGPATVNAFLGNISGATATAAGFIHAELVKV